MKIAVDLDGTLAEYHGWQGELHIGKPIPLMLDRVRQWLAEGNEVVIFTARIAGRDGVPRESVVARIRDWLLVQGLPRLEVTNIKAMDFAVFYDDRCVQVEPNTGVLTVDAAITALQHAP